MKKRFFILIYFIYLTGLFPLGERSFLISLAEEKKSDPSHKEEGAVINNLKFVKDNEKENEMRAFRTEMLIQDSEQKAIQQINKLLRKYKGSPLEAGLIFRLAELYMRRSKSDLFFEVHRQSDTFISVAPEVVKSASSKKTIKAAVDIYESLEKKFPHFEQMDVVLFNHGFALQQLSQPQEAEKHYWQLIKNYSDSALVPDAHLAIGEMAFAKQNFTHALEHFNAIKKYPDSRVYPYGLYKAGWTYYNLHNALEGLKQLEMVVEFGYKVASQNIDARLDLRKEALSDMTLFFEEVLPAEKAWSYFSYQGRGLDVAPYLLKLSYLYKRHSRYNDINLVLSDMIKNLPLSQLRPEAESELIIANDYLKDYERAVKYMSSLSWVCTPEGEWEKAQPSSQQADHFKGNLQAQNLCREKVTFISRKLALKWFGMWQKNKSQVLLADSAEKSFSIYLKHSLESQESHDVRYSYGELLFQRNKFREASAQYTWVGMKSPKSKQSHDALYAALLALEKAAGAKWSDRDEKEFQSLVGEYVRRNPKGSYRLDLEFKMALIAYEKNNYTFASPIFERLGNDYFAEGKGQKSQDLYLDILNIQKQYTQLKKYSLQLRNREKTTERKEKLTHIYEQAYFLEIQTQEEKNEWSDALSGYKKFVLENPKSSLAEKAWWNAIALYFRLGDLMGGAQACTEYHQLFPQSPKVVDALLRGVQTYEEVARLELAAPLLLQLSQLDKKSYLKWRSLSADYYFLSGQETKSAEIYQELIKAKDHHVSSHAIQQLELIAQMKNNESEQKKFSKMLAGLGIEPQASTARLESLEKTYQKGQMTEAFNEAKKIISLGKTVSSQVLARARFIQAEVLSQEFSQQSVKAKAERVATVLALKTQKLEKAQQAYQDVMKYGDSSSTVQALEKMSDLYRLYVESLRKMPLPEGLSSTDEPAFRDEIEKLAIPLEEKSVESMAQAVDAARKLQLKDGSVARLQQRLNQLNMSKEEVKLFEVQNPALVLPGWPLKEVKS